MPEPTLRPLDEFASARASAGSGPRSPSEPDPGRYRSLSAREIEQLVKNGNNADDWKRILVSRAFDPDRVVNCEFHGSVYLGDTKPECIEYNDLRLPVGLRNSTIISCVIGDDVAIRDVHYLARYRIGDRCILFNVDEMLCTDHAKFGNGIVMEGEEESVRIWLEAGNENDGRKILPFEGLIPADAYLWAKYRGDPRLLSRLVEVTEGGFSRARGAYGEIGRGAVIKNCSIIKDVKVGPCAYIKGANKLKNLTVLSSAEEPSQIGEGVEMVNGIVGYGSRAFYGSKAVRFVMGRNTQLKYGARLINSVLGDNSTVSCCELLNNLIFPFHEQHHNNSFLIAATVMGQSNIAAGATIGSNHNSRAPDGEIVAGRGFWPGLCSSFKHNSRFASFSLVAKGSYSYEMDVAYPFSLVSLSREDDALRVSPAYWFVHNMYAMARNSWKFGKRDARAVKVQHIEVEYLAPDTVGEMLAAMSRLEGLAAGTAGADAAGAGREAARRRFAELPEDRDESLFDPGLMKRYGGFVEKPARAWRSYRAFCAYFAVKTLVDRFRAEAGAGLGAFIEAVEGIADQPNYDDWVNLGGQIIPKDAVDGIRRDIVEGKLESWNSIHARYDRAWNEYPGQKARFALRVLERLYGRDPAALPPEAWLGIIRECSGTFAAIRDSAFESRRKDFEDPFRKMVYDDDAEMAAVLGRFDDNPFLTELSARTDAYLALLGGLARG